MQVVGIKLPALVCSYYFLFLIFLICKEVQGMCQHVLVAVSVFTHVSAFQTHHVRIIWVTVWRKYGRSIVECPLLSLHYRALMSHLYYPHNKQIL